MINRSVISRKGEEEEEEEEEEEDGGVSGFGYA